jgi:hypothetical protein
MDEDKAELKKEDVVFVLVLPDEAAVKEVKGLLTDILNRLDEPQPVVELEKPSEN